MPIIDNLEPLLAASGQYFSNPLFVAGAVFAAIGFVVWFLSRCVTMLGPIEPLRLDEHTLPTDFAEFADRIDSELRPLEFRAAGDYQLVHGRNPEFVRYYAGVPAHVFAEAAVYRNMAGNPLWRRDARILTYTTVLEDGTYLQTGDIPLPDGGANAPPKMLLFGAPHLPPREMLAAHLEHVNRCTAERGAQPLICPPDAFVQVTAQYMRYQREYFGQMGGLQCSGAAPIEFPRLPAGCRAAADSTTELTETAGHTTN